MDGVSIGSAGHGLGVVGYGDGSAGGLTAGSPAVAGGPVVGRDLCGLGVSDGDLRSVLGPVVRLTVEMVPHAAAASVTVGSPAGPDLLVASSSMAQAGDGIQFAASAGPTFDAFRLRQPVRKDDLVDDERWAPLRGPATEPDPIRSVLAMPMLADDAVVGVLTLYSRRPGAFGDEAADRLVPFVATAERLLRDHRRIAELRLLSEQLEEALTSRAVIDQAKGMIMLTRRCGPDEAFDVLRRMSNANNRKVRDMAAEMIAKAGRQR